MAKSKKLVTKATDTGTPQVTAKDKEYNPALFYKTIRQTLGKMKCKNVHQQEPWDMIEAKEVIICSGPAGTGKTHIAMAKALELFTREGSTYKEIILVKPIVEADENLGFLPGDVQSKIDPYMESFFYLIEQILSKRALEKLTCTTSEESTRRPVIKCKPLAFMRGITINDSIVLMDESQNMTHKQLKTFLTRLSRNNKFIVMGDLDQSDKHKHPKDTGLYKAKIKFTNANIPGMGLMSFDKEDIVRNPMIALIIDALDAPDVS